MGVEPVRASGRLWGLKNLFHMLVDLFLIFLKKIVCITFQKLYLKCVFKFFLVIVLFIAKLQCV